MKRENKTNKNVKYIKNRYNKNKKSFFHLKLKKYRKEDIKIFLTNLLHKITLRKVCLFFLIISIFALITWVYFNYTLLVTIDGSVYHHYLKYFYGLESIKTWPAIRGFSFPLILFLFSNLFGNNIKGYLIGFYLFYILTFIIAALLLRKCINNTKAKYHQAPIWVLFVCLFIFNPLILGYSHTLLTEAVVPCFYLLLVYLCLKWKDLSFKNDKVRFIVVSSFLILLAVFMWFIKQPYAPAVWVMILITAVLSGIMNKNFKMFLSKFSVFIIMFIFTFISIKTWDCLISDNGSNSSDTNTSFMSSVLITGRDRIRLVADEKKCNVEYYDELNLKEKDRDKLDNIMEDDDWCEKVLVYDIYNSKEDVIDTNYFIFNSSDISVKDGMKVLLTNFFEHPLIMIDEYFHYYLSIINFEDYSLNRNADTFPPRELSSTKIDENVGISYVVFKPYIKNCWWQWDDYSGNEVLKYTEGMDDFVDTINYNLNLTAIVELLEPLSSLTFMFGLLFALPIFIYGLIKCIKNRNSISYFLITILSGAAFTGVFFHVFCNAIIDRYAYPSYPLILLCLIIMFIDKRELDLKEVNNNGEK